MKLILILLISSLTHLAYSKTIFEPGLTLGMGSGDAKVQGFSNSQNPKGDGTVASFGFRYGITRRYIHVTGIVEGTIFAGEDIDAKFLGFGGLGIGYEWNIPLRTYLIAGAYDFDTDYVGTGVEMAYLFNDSFWIGVRYINFATALTQEFGTQEVTAELDLNTISLVVSFPFEFNYPDHWFRKTDWQ